MEAAASLRDDSPAQRAEDEAIMATRRQGHDVEVRARLMARLDDMAIRLGAQAE
jgi:hypothetical protein